MDSQIEGSHSVEQAAGQQDWGRTIAIGIVALGMLVLVANLGFPRDPLLSPGLAVAEFEGVRVIGSEPTDPYTLTHTHTGTLMTTLTATVAVPLTVSQSGGLPYPWAHRDVGDVGKPGAAEFSQGVFAIEGGAADGRVDDGFHYVHHRLVGDGEIVARVASLEGDDPGARAGIMVRESRAADARHVLVATSLRDGVLFQRRMGSGKAAEYVVSGEWGIPCWVRLVRGGRTITGYGSADGERWVEIDSVRVDFEGPVMVGLAVTARDNARPLSELDVPFVWMRAGRFAALAIGLLGGGWLLLRLARGEAQQG